MPEFRSKSRDEWGKLSEQEKIDYLFDASGILQDSKLAEILDFGGKIDTVLSGQKLHQERDNREFENVDRRFSKQDETLSKQDERLQAILDILRDTTDETTGEKKLGMATKVNETYDFKRTAKVVIWVAVSLFTSCLGVLGVIFAYFHK